MPDQHDPDPGFARSHHDADTPTTPDAEQARIALATARADIHAVRELFLLELAVEMPDDNSARQLESYAYDAYRDAHAITQEHDLDT